jgi:hypothetical protein
MAELVGATLGLISRYTPQLYLLSVMKFLHILLAAGICSASAAQAQTAPAQTTPTNPSTLTPSSAAPALSPNSAANASRDLPATGAPDAIDNTMSTDGKRMSKGKKQKTHMSSGSGKMKTKM